MKTVDILLPTYNGSKFLKEQISSILNQTYKNIKLLIRDDGSIDNTKEIINTFKLKDRRIVVFDDVVENLGLVANNEYLLRKSTAEYIMYCDQDDFWFPEKVEILVNLINSIEMESGVKLPLLVHSDAYVTNEKLEVQSKLKNKTPLKYGLNKSLFKYHVQGASSLFNDILKEKILPFPNTAYLHDRYTHLVAEILGRRVYLNSPLMYYRQHASNLVGSKGLLDKLKNNIFKKNSYYLSKDKELIKSLASRYKTLELLDIYLKITEKGKIHKVKKIYLIIKYKISLRPKELFWLLIKG